MIIFCAFNLLSFFPVSFLFQNYIDIFYQKTQYIHFHLSRKLVLYTLCICDIQYAGGGFHVCGI